MLMMEETSSERGFFKMECEVLSKRKQGNLYFIEELQTGRVFCRARNKLKPLSEVEPDSVAMMKLEEFTFRMEEVNIPEILIKPGQGQRRKDRRKLGVSFDGTAHVERTRLPMRFASTLENSILF